MFGKLELGGVVTLVAANADVGGYDGRVRCMFLSCEYMLTDTEMCDVDALPDLPLPMPPFTCLALESHWLVRKTKTVPLPIPKKPSSGILRCYRPVYRRADILCADEAAELLCVQRAGVLLTDKYVVFIYCVLR